MSNGNQQFGTFTNGTTGQSYTSVFSNNVVCVAAMKRNSRSGSQYGNNGGDCSALGSRTAGNNGFSFSIQAFNSSNSGITLPTGSGILSCADTFTCHLTGKSIAIQVLMETIFEF